MKLSQIILAAICALMMWAPGAQAVSKSVQKLCPAEDTRQHRTLVTEACADVRGWLEKVPGGRVVTRRGSFTDERFECARVGCEVTLSGRFSALGQAQPPELMIEERLKAKGWIHTSAHDADGPDGTVFSLHKTGAICIVEGSWNHWDDEDGPHTDDLFQTRVSCGVATAQPPSYEDVLEFKGRNTDWK